MRTDFRSRPLRSRDLTTTQGLTNLFVIASRDFGQRSSLLFATTDLLIMWSSYHLVNFCELMLRQQSVSGHPFQRGYNRALIISPDRCILSDFSHWLGSHWYSQMTTLGIFVTVQGSSRLRRHQGIQKGLPKWNFGQFLECRQKLLLLWYRATQLCICIMELFL